MKSESFGYRMMNRLIITAAAIVVCLNVLETRAYALGTPAGTVISSQSTVTYSVAGFTFSNSSSSAPIIVAELLDVALTWQDAAPITVAPGQSGTVATFRATNTGNGDDEYSLVTDDQLGGDDFNPAATAIYLDANGNGIYDSAADSLYSGSTGTVSPDNFLTIFVLSTMPSSSLGSGDIGMVQLAAASMTGTGPAGTVLANQGDGGIDAIIGSAGGAASATATYFIRTIQVSLSKTAVVVDQYGGSRPQQGAVISYTITVSATGVGTAANVIVTDPIPVNTTYVPGTLRRGNEALTDGSDGDAGDFNITAPGAVSVRMGGLTAASPVETITFNVTIN